MILKDTLRTIVRSQKEQAFSDTGFIEREALSRIKIDTPFAIAISGIRRCGKSTLLRQLMRLKKVVYYFNFEDPKATDFELSDFPRLDEVFHEEYGESVYYFFDEIQNVEKWELYVRSLLDQNKHCIITGSNASLLSRELGTRLTGRHLRHELFPFSFREYLSLAHKKPGLRSYEDYFTNGGFPQYLKLRDPAILQELFSDIIARDIAIRHKIRNIQTLKQMALYLVSNIGKEFSYNSLKKIFGLGSVNSVISFISFFEESYMLFTVPRFDYSLKKQLVNPKKIYSIDNGFSAQNSASFSDDKGRMLENQVFLHLRQRYKEIFYYRDNSECDFVAKEDGRIAFASQVCYELNEENREREVGGLSEAMQSLKLKEGLILTYNQEDKFDIDGRHILVKPVWKWLCE